MYVMLLIMIKNKTKIEICSISTHIVFVYIVFLILSNGKLFNYNEPESSSWFIFNIIKMRPHQQFVCI